MEWHWYLCTPHAAAPPVTHSVHPESQPGWAKLSNGHPSTSWLGGQTSSGQGVTFSSQAVQAGKVGPAGSRMAAAAPSLTGHVTADRPAVPPDRDRWGQGGLLHSDDRDRGSGAAQGDHPAQVRGLRPGQGRRCPFGQGLAADGVAGVERVQAAIKAKHPCLAKHIDPELAAQHTARSTAALLIPEDRPKNVVGRCSMLGCLGQQTSFHSCTQTFTIKLVHSLPSDQQVCAGAPCSLAGSAFAHSCSVIGHMA